MMLPGSSFTGILWKFLNKPKNTRPAGIIPSVKTDLKHFHSSAPAITWFGHSSYLIHINGKNILVDPVFSGHASPFTFGVRSFPGSNVYTVADLPPIDLLLSTHDHYDHLDYQTMLELKDKVSLVLTSPGVGSHLVYWGMDRQIITETGWNESSDLPGGMKITAAPARHFSGRGLSRGKTFWSAFILQSGQYKIYIGGDSVYDSHFATTGKMHGPFDIAMLECGQYDKHWPYIHMMPEQTAQAAVDLGAKLLLPVHWAKFPLSLHPWDEPVKRLLQKSRELQLPITTPRICEPVILGGPIPNSNWWKE